MQNSPVSNAIAAFGDAAALSRATGIPIRRIWGWEAPADQKGGAGRIPAKHQGVILLAARRHRVRLKGEDLIDFRGVKLPPVREGER